MDSRTQKKLTPKQKGFAQSVVDDRNVPIPSWCRYMMGKSSLAVSLAVIVLAAACGGGEGSTASAPDVPTAVVKSTGASVTSSAKALAHFEADVALFQQGHLEEALAEFDEVIRLDPEHAVAYSNRGNTYLQLGQLERAIRDIDEAIRIDPQSALAYNNQGSVYSGLGQYQRAVEIYDGEVLRRSHPPRP